MTAPDISAAFRAVQTGDKSIAPTFLEAVLKGNPKAAAWRNDEKRTLLMEAAFNGRANLVDMLVRAGSEIDARDAHDWTPLMLATLHGHDDNVRLLLAAGADVNAKSLHGATALTFAITYQRNAVLGLLLDAGADANAGYPHAPNLVQAIHAARGKPAVIKTLLARGVDIDARDAQGRTALDVLSVLIDDNEKRGGPYLGNAAFYGRLEKLIRDEAARRQKAPDSKPRRP